MFQYNTQGVCSKAIYFDIEDNKLKNVSYLGGIGSLVEGMDIDDVISRLEGTTCGSKKTSCPDQLAKALKAYKEEIGK